MREEDMSLEELVDFKTLDDAEKFVEDELLEHVHVLAPRWLFAAAARPRRRPRRVRSSSRAPPPPAARRRCRRRPRPSRRR